MRVVSIRTYFFTFAALLGLALLTTLLGFINMGPFNNVVAIAIAVCKASLIALFFMHARYEGKLIRVVMSAGVIWILILISLTISDYVTRGGN